VKILIVAATKHETEKIQNSPDFGKPNEIDKSEFVYKNLNIRFLITGIGSVFTCFKLTEHLLKYSYDLIINIGIAGAYNKSLSIGETTLVYQECFGDLGIDDQGEFKTIFDEGFMSSNQKPFNESKINALEKEYSSFLNQLTKVKGITVNTASGSEKKITQLNAKFNGDIETMEGASFFYVCKQLQQNFIQIRSISNYVTKRDKSKWNIPLAIENLSNSVIDFLNKIAHENE